jgi:hypothetical protein
MIVKVNLLLSLVKRITKITSDQVPKAPGDEYYSRREKRDCGHRDCIALIIKVGLIPKDGGLC